MREFKVITDANMAKPRNDFTGLYDKIADALDAPGKCVVLPDDHPAVSKANVPNIYRCMITRGLMVSVRRGAGNTMVVVRNGIVKVIKD